MSPANDFLIVELSEPMSMHGSWLYYKIWLNVYKQMRMGTLLCADYGVCFLSGDWSVENLFPFPGLICLKLP